MPFILVAVLIDMVSVGLVMPVLPGLVGSFAGSLQDQAFWYGLVALSFGAANFVAAPVLGALSDAHGRRPVLLLGFTGVVVGLGLIGLATALWVVVVARLVGGAMQANLAVANAYVADITPADRRAARFGLIGAMMGLGVVVGPALGGLLGAVDLRLPFALAAALGLVNAAYGGWVLPESLPPDKRRAFDWARATAWGGRHDVHAAIPGRRALVLSLGMNAMAQATFATAWVLYAHFRFGWGPRESGLSMFVIGISTLVVQGVLTQRFSGPGSTAALAVTGMASAVIAYLLFGWVREAWMVWPVVLLHAAGFASVAALQGEVVHAGDGADQGHVFGQIASLNALAGVLAPALGGACLTLVATLPPRDWRLGLPLYACALLQLGALVAALGYFRRATRRAVPGPSGRAGCPDPLRRADADARQRDLRAETRGAGDPEHRTDPGPRAEARGGGQRVNPSAPMP